jgi:hypothetical protein
LSEGWSFERLQNWRPRPTLRDEEPVVYGTPLFASAIAAFLDLALLEPTFDWLAGLPSDWTKREIHCLELGGAREFGRTFIKPADDKCFPAQVYDSGVEVWELSLPRSTPIIISDPVVWEIEFRSFVADRNVVAMAPYLINGELAHDSHGNWLRRHEHQAEARDFVESFLEDPNVEIPPGVVVDVGKIAGTGWAVIEANSAWGSGLYACNAIKALGVLKRACHLSEAAGQHAKWVVSRSGSSGETI